MRIPIFSTILFAFFVLLWQPVAAQRYVNNNADLHRVQDLHKIKLSLVGLTYQWEKTLNRKSVLTAEAGLAGGMAFSSNTTDGTNFRYAIVPEVGVGFRNYYNLDRRARNGKSTENNAANFIAADVFVNGNSIVSSRNTQSSEAVGITAAWGMQRPVSKRINFEWQAGIITGTDFDVWVAAPNLRIGLSFLAGKGK